MGQRTDGRFESYRHEAIDDGWGVLDEAPERLRTRVETDTARTVISRNNSPDIPFDQSINHPAIKYLTADTNTVVDQLNAKLRDGSAKLVFDEKTGYLKSVLDLLSKGYLYKEISDSLGVSVPTISTYIRRIYEKLQVHSRTQAVSKYLRKQG